MMKRELAKATMEQLREDDRVNDVLLDENEKGLFVEATASNRMDARSLRDDLNQYPVFVKVVT